MNITTTLNKKSNPINKKYIVIMSLVLLVFVSLWVFSFVTNSPSFPLDSLRVTAIEQGSFTVNVDGYGRLRSKHQRLLTSQTPAIVESIALYPGAKVTKDSIILTLSDPQLEQAVVNARLELARQNAEAKEQVIAHKSALLERDAQIALLQSDLENAELRADAEQKLIDKGIVSLLDYKRTQLDVRQLSQRLGIEKMRQEQLKNMQIERLSIFRDLIIQYELNFQTIKNRFDRLTVRAGLDGVLQTLPVEIGQSVMPGTQLATVGSSRVLVAELRIQQNQADQINIGMLATIRTSGNKIPAKVIRIDPIVTDGRVMIELDLIGDLPINARPDLTVEGQILVKQMNDVLFVEKPSETYSFKNKDIFIVSSDKKTAQLSAIEFGTISGNLIHVIGGVQHGDKIVISDMSQWNSFQQIELTN